MSKNLTKARKKMEKWFLTEQYNREDRNEISGVAFALYCLSGGFCFDPNVRKNFRKVWIFYNIFCFISVYASSIFYFINAPIIDYYAMLVPAPLMAGIISKIVAYVWIYVMRDFLWKLFAFLSQNDHDTSVVELAQWTPLETICTSSLKTLHLKKLVDTVIMILSGIVIAIMLGYSYENFESNDNYVIIRYPMYVPFEKSPQLRFLINLFQLVTIAPELIIFVTFPILLFLLGIDIYNSFVFLAQKMRSTSHTVFKTMEDIRQLEIAFEEKRIPSSLSKIHEMKIRKALAIDQYITDLTQVIKHHQQLLSTARMYSGRIKYVFSSGFMILSLTATVSAFLFSSIFDKEDVVDILLLTLPGIIIVCGVALCWFLYCFVGEKFGEMNDLIAAEVYSSPWYYLEPKDRRLVLTFLSILQRPLGIIVCGILPVNLSVFPDTINRMYSQVRILRTLQLNKQ